MKKSNITVNAENGTLVMTKAFYKRACAFGSAEYYELREAQSENKGFRVVFGYKVSSKETYGGLNYARMEAYIKSQPNSEERMLEFKVVQQIAKVKGSAYPLVKKWFLLTYPEFKVNAVSEDEKASELAKAKVEAERKMALIAGGLETAAAANF